MNAATWLPLASVAGAVVAALISMYGARRSGREQADVQHRTLSWQEMEGALKFTGEQLGELRRLYNEQHDEIWDLQLKHEECERDKRKLNREIVELKGRL